jgi:hypothetical protein
LLADSGLLCQKQCDRTQEPYLEALVVEDPADLEAHGLRVRADPRVPVEQRAERANVLELGRLRV